MNKSYEPEMEFYGKPYSVDQLINKFDFPTLIAYYIYGMNTLRAIQEVIDEDLYKSIDRSFKDVQEDKFYFTMRTAIVKNALTTMEPCEILKVSNNLFVYHLN